MLGGLCVEQESSRSPGRLLHEKELQLEVERLRFRCRDGDVRTAALLQDLQQAQRDIMNHQNTSKASEIKLQQMECAAKVCLVPQV